MRQFFILSLNLILLINFGTYGQVDIENIKSQPYLKYKDKVNCDSATTTLELRICANIAFQLSDSILNNIYNSILLKLDGQQMFKEVENIKESQLDWIKYRDNHCKVYWNMYDGGTLQSVIYLNCLTNITNTRQKELKELLDELNQ